VYTNITAAEAPTWGASFANWAADGVQQPLGCLTGLYCSRHWRQACCLPGSRTPRLHGVTTHERWRKCIAQGARSLTHHEKCCSLYSVLVTVRNSLHYSVILYGCVMKISLACWMKWTLNH